MPLFTAATVESVVGGGEMLGKINELVDSCIRAGRGR
jgi:hypothetical protein